MPIYSYGPYSYGRSMRLLLPIRRCGPLATNRHLRVGPQGGRGETLFSYWPHPRTETSPPSIRPDLRGAVGLASLAVDILVLPPNACRRVLAHLRSTEVPTRRFAFLFARQVGRRHTQTYPPGHTHNSPARPHTHTWNPPGHRHTRDPPGPYTLGTRQATDILGTRRATDTLGTRQATFTRDPPARPDTHK